MKRSDWLKIDHQGLITSIMSILKADTHALNLANLSILSIFYWGVIII